ncbi:MAG: hypothetical protein EOO63_06540 [Hymenobacter sp.]|nr:MAG: hypothetical protein EOO63_06540 [Hymenobacter sp.]
MVTAIDLRPGDGSYIKAINRPKPTALLIDLDDSIGAGFAASNPFVASDKTQMVNILANKTGANSSRCSGVSWKSREQRWAAPIRLDGKNE